MGSSLPIGTFATRLSAQALRPALGSGRSGTLIGVGPGLCELRRTKKAKFAEIVIGELPRITIPRTPVNKARAEMLGSAPFVTLVFV
jgi:hypothetical protein